jgi:hypothetical protein
MLSNVLIEGKYAKNFPCCQCVIPGTEPQDSQSSMLGRPLTWDNEILEVFGDLGELFSLGRGLG